MGGGTAPSHCLAQHVAIIAKNAEFRQDLIWHLHNSTKTTKVSIAEEDACSSVKPDLSRRAPSALAGAGLSTEGKESPAGARAEQNHGTAALHALL